MNRMSVQTCRENYASNLNQTIINQRKQRAEKTKAEEADGDQEATEARADRADMEVELDRANERRTHQAKKKLKRSSHNDGENPGTSTSSAAIKVVGQEEDKARDFSIFS